MADWRDIAASQQHVISRSQLIAAGLSEDGIRGLCSDGTLESKLRGVYRLRGTKRTWEQRLSEACLWGGPNAAASFCSAAALHKLDGFERSSLEISTAKQKQVGGKQKFRVHRWDVDPRHITHIDGIPVTNAHRTLRDLLPTLTAERAERVLDDALRKGLVTVESLARFVGREKGSGHRGLRRMRQIVLDRGAAYQPSASEMNTRIKLTLLAFGIYDFIEEYEMYDEDGLIGRAHVGFPDRVVAEGQSRKHHTNKEDFERDLDRRSRAAAAGYPMIEISWKVLVENPERFIGQIRRARAQRAKPT